MQSSRTRKPEGTQFHHLVPEQILTGKLTKLTTKQKEDFVEARVFLEEHGFDWEYLKSVGINLPTGKVDYDTKRCRHVGFSEAHADYNRDVVKALLQIRATAEAEETPPEIIKKQIYRKIEDFRQEFRNRFDHPTRDLISEKRRTKLEEPSPQQTPQQKSAQKKLAEVGKDQKQRAFEAGVVAAGLGDTFDSAHPEQPIRRRAGAASKIGGVGQSVANISFEESISDVLDREHWFAIPSDAAECLISNEDLQEIIRVIAYAEYVHGKRAIFSLHFNRKGHLTPIIDDVFKHTKVGEVMGLLDYIMKGYLNGGIFDKDFMFEWQNNPTTNESDLSKRLIDFHDYCKKHLGDEGEGYKSLREIMTAFGLSDTVPPDELGRISTYAAKFETTFRIIAEQTEIEKAGPMFVLHPSFKVEYTIKGTKEFESYIKKHEEEHGTKPADYEQINNIYQYIAKKIEEDLPRLPMCKEYFALLGLINFLTYYFKSLKGRQRVPRLGSFTPKSSAGIPAILPPLPVKYIRRLSP